MSSHHQNHQHRMCWPLFRHLPSLRPQLQILVSGLVALHANMRIRVPANATPAERAQYAEDDATSGRDYDLLVQALGATKFVQSLTEAFVHEKYGDDYALLDAEFRTAQAGPTPEVLDLDVPPANDPGAN